MRRICQPETGDERLFGNRKAPVPLLSLTESLSELLTHALVVSTDTPVLMFPLCDHSLSTGHFEDESRFRVCL